MVSNNIAFNFRARLNRLRLLLPSLPCDCLLIEHPVDLFYLTGLEISTGKLLISIENAVLMVDARYYEICSRQTLCPVLLLQENSLKDWIVEKGHQRLGFNTQQTTYQNFLSLEKLSKTLEENGHFLKIIPLESTIQQLRIIKDAEERLALRNAAALGKKGFTYVKSLLQEGITETEIALELEFFWRKQGASGIAFESIIAFGPNGSMPHYRAGTTPLESNTSVLVDIGVTLNHYHSDMTRVIYFGTPSPIIQTLYSIVEEAQAKAIALCKPGTFVRELDQAARTWIAAKGYGAAFTHSLGHGIGLEVHESPIIRSTGPYQEMSLQEGMVITIEPGIYLPGVGGIRLEEMVLITSDGCEIL